MPTALEIVQGRQTPLTSGLLMAVQTQAPLFSRFYTQTIGGTTFQTLALTGLPSSAFVNLNEGFTASACTLALRDFECKLIGGQIKEEVITAQRWNDNHRQSGYTYFDLQMEAKIKADVRHVERVMVYGTAYDAKGFPGLKELTPYASGNVLALTDTAADTEFVKSVINAAGSTSSTGSSVYSIVFGDMDASLVFGNDQGGELFTISDTIQQMLAPDPTNAPTATSLHNVAQLHGWVGLSVSGMNQTPNSTVPTQYSVRRLANVTAQNGYTLTDAMLSKLARSHGDGVMPSVLAMSHRSGEQLAASRAATGSTVFFGGVSTAKGGTLSLTPMPPPEWEGIPIIYASAIGVTDAIEA